jgi:hypothetical protein
VGRVFTRRFGATNADRTNSANRSRAISLFRAWLRVSSTNKTTAPSFVQRRPANRRSRALTAPDNAGDRAASNRNSTALDTLFTFCPPGPDDRTNCSVSSQSSI